MHFHGLRKVRNTRTLRHIWKLAEGFWRTQGSNPCLTALFKRFRARYEQLTLAE